MDITRKSKANAKNSQNWSKGEGNSRKKKKKSKKKKTILKSIAMATVSTTIE